jgi:hypothetical protein
MSPRPPISLVMLALLAIVPFAAAESGTLKVPKTVEAGKSFSIATNASSGGVLYVFGFGDVVRREVHPGGNVLLEPSDIHNAGHYLVTLAANSLVAQAEFDVIASPKPASLNFLAKPSRLPVDMQGGISGVVYVFDVFRNLILQPTPVSFQLVGASVQTTSTQNGVAWMKMSSAPKAGFTQLQASVGGVTETRIVQQVPGDACDLRMSVRASGQRIVLETDPVRDCRGNALPDGTIVTFTESHKGRPVATVDVPLKRDVAKTEIPAYRGAVISVATGVVTGNEVRMGAGK